MIYAALSVSDWLSALAAAFIFLVIVGLFVRSWLARQDNNSADSAESWSKDQRQSLNGYADTLALLRTALSQAGLLAADLEQRLSIVEEKIGRRLTELKADPRAALEKHANLVGKPPFLSVPISASASALYDAANALEAEVHLMIFAALNRLWTWKIEKALEQFPAGNAQPGDSQATSREPRQLTAPASDGPAADEVQPKAQDSGEDRPCKA